MDASLWGPVGGRKSQRERKRYFESFTQRQNLINSSDDDDSENDEEWIKQLQRDYGRCTKYNKTKWTRSEKVLAFSLFCTLLLALFLLTALLYSRYKHNSETLLEFTLGGQQFCNKVGCVLASHRVLSYSDKTSSPCHSFYKHACGSWFREAEIPSMGNTELTSFTEVLDRNKRTLKRLLDNMALVSDQHGSKTLTKVQTFYKSCLRKEYIESHSNQSLLELINYVGSWALTNTSRWNEEDWSFEQTLTRIHHLKSMPLFYMYVAADDKNSTENVIQIEQSGLTMNDENMYERPENDTIVKSYEQLIIRVGMLLGGRNETVYKQAVEVFKFEKSLAQIYEMKSKHSAEQVYDKITVAELQQLCPAIPWLDYMNSMFSEPVRSDEKIVVYTPDYLKKMSDLVIKTERRIIANYMVWHLIKPILLFLSKPYRTVAMDYAVKETGTKGAEEDSWKNCITETDSVLGFGTGYLFVKDAEARGVYDENKVKRMLHLVKEEFMLNLHHLSWMDDVTKKRAVDKAISIIDLVGYPSWIKDAHLLDLYYDNLNISDDPLRNYFNARQFYHSKTMERRGRLVHKNEWHVTPTEVNAYYNAPNNYLALPIGLLQPPFFSTDYPKSINFGALGSIMGHELIHGFDTQGRVFDSTGNLQSWWTNKTTKSFENETNCMVDHYKSFDEKRDGARNLIEDLADNGGLKVAHNAFKSAEYIDGEDVSLPGLSLSSDQLFFMGYAQRWCSLSTNDKLAQGEQNSAMIRVDATLANSKQFSKAYKCPIGSRMNPKKKCRIF